MILKDQYSFRMEQSNSFGVAIGYSGTKFFILEKRKMDKTGCLLRLNITTDKQNFVLLNLCNANTQKDQLNTTNELSEML